MVTYIASSRTVEVPSLQAEVPNNEDMAHFYEYHVILLSFLFHLDQEIVL